MRRILFILIMIGAGACARNRANETQFDRAMQLLNERCYPEAVELLQSEHEAHPENSEVSLLLAQAHLGMAHFEIFSFAESVMSEQDPDRRTELSFQMPECGNGALSKLDETSFRCLLYRVAQNLPQVEDPHFILARRILYQAFPTVESTPMDANFLMALLDLSTAMNRVRTVFLKVNEPVLRHSVAHGEVTEQQFRLVVRNLKRFMSELKSGIFRARHSYHKIQRQLAELNGVPLFRIGSQALVFNDAAGFASEIPRKSTELIMASVGESVGASDPAMQLLIRFDEVFFSGENLRNFEKLRGRPIDSPPPMLSEFGKALQESWDLETRAPMIAYLKKTREQWAQLTF